MLNRKRFENLPAFLKRDCGLVNASRTNNTAVVPQVYIEVSVIGAEYCSAISQTFTRRF